MESYSRWISCSLHLKFERIWDSRIRADWEGRKLGVVSRDGLIALKELRSSGQDLDDIRHLTEESLDEER